MDRRTFLRGAGTLIALPFLEAMMPLKAFAQAAGAPQRFVALYFGNGARGWDCSGTENNWTLSNTLQGLAPYKNDISSVQGLVNDAGLFGSSLDSTTAHWQASVTFLTGQTYDWANRANRVALYSAGSSVDQIIAQATPNSKKSLVMGCHPTYLYPGGSTDQRGSHAYLTHISWSNQTTQTPRFVSSASVFNYLFSNGVPAQSNAAALQRAAQKKSILDDVLGEIQKLKQKLGSNDKQKLDEYLTSVNEVQKRIASEAANSQVACTIPNSAPFSADNNNDIPSPYANTVVNQRARNLSDLLTIAFQCDITRVSSFILVTEHSYIEDFYYDTGAGIRNAHHEASHGLNDRPDDVVANVNRWAANQYAYLIGKLKTTSDAYGPLLNNTLLMLGTGMGNQNTNDHDLNKVSMILAGRGGGHVPGRLINVPGAKHSDFLATIAQKFGQPAKVGMSTGTIAKI